MTRNMGEEWDYIRLWGWECVSCKSWNLPNRKKCWHCDGPPEARPTNEVGGEG